jgi:hypothetical protein
METKVLERYQVIPLGRMCCFFFLLAPQSVCWSRAVSHHIASMTCTSVSSRMCSTVERYFAAFIPQLIMLQLLRATHTSSTPSRLSVRGYVCRRSNIGNGGRGVEDATCFPLAGHNNCYTWFEMWCIHPKSVPLASSFHGMQCPIHTSIY